MDGEEENCIKIYVMFIPFSLLVFLQSKSLISDSGVTLSPSLRDPLREAELLLDGNEGGKESSANKSTVKSPVVS